MFKYGESYILSNNKDKDLGKVKILGVVDKRNIKVKKRMHRINKKFEVVKVMNIWYTYLNKVGIFCYVR